MCRFIPNLAFLTVLLMAFMGPVPAALLVSPAAAGIVSVEEAMSEMVLGKPDAPVTMIEYSSLGCPNCADFHRDTLPRIKTEYVDTGKVRLIYRDFPLGTPALAASMIARCAGPEKYFGFIDIIYRSQAQWSRSNNPLDALSQVARFGGMSKADVGACLKTQALLDHIRRVATLAQETQKVVSTPTFIIGDQTITGAQPFENFKKAIDKALNK